MSDRFYVGTRKGLFVYDAYAGGAGIAELGWEAGTEHLAATLEAIDSCECTDGCPSCVQSPKCGNGNDPLDKAGAYAIQEHGERVVAATSGLYTNIVGLPVEEVLERLGEVTGNW